MFFWLVCVVLFPGLITGNQLQPDKISARIVGGVPVDIKNFPYQVYLDIGNGKYGCGGVIISESFILSAGHCVEGYENLNLTIRVNSSLRVEGGNVHSVKNRYPHPEYKFMFFPDYDLSILELETPLIFGDGVQPIRLPETNEQLPKRAVLTISGWGATTMFDVKLGRVSPVLRAVNVTSYTNEECRTSYEFKNFIFWLISFFISIPNDRMICGNVPGGGHNGCAGDSGGPVVHDGVVYGLVSWGDHEDCSSAEYAGIYTSIAHPSLRAFISDTTGI